jgi:hypothetical protein
VYAPLLLFAPLLILCVSEAQPVPGFLEGQLKIFSPQTVDLADGNLQTVTPETYAEYPLVVFAQDGKTQVTTFTADKGGRYRVALPPGSYVLDVKDRVRKHLRAKPQPFRVVSNQAVTLNMDMDTGIR